MCHRGVQEAVERRAAVEREMNRATLELDQSRESYESAKEKAKAAKDKIE